MGKGVWLGEFEQMVLLALIHLKDNAYGMRIRREIVSRTEREVSIGSVYATLSRLEGKGYLSSKMGEATPERGGKAKRFFSINGAGVAALRESQQMRVRMLAGFEPLGGFA